jgi:hypothetical protein
VIRVIRYWTTRISRNGIQYADDIILEYYLKHSDVDVTYFDKTLTVYACVVELRNAKARFKDVLVNAISSCDLYEVEVATSRVE